MAIKQVTDSKYPHLSKWTRPECYIGASWYGWYAAPVGQSRDSDALERANFDAAKLELEALPEVEVDEDDGMAGVQIVRESHWAVGWVEWIAIHESNVAALELAESIMARLEDYPVIDEDLWSRYEDEDCRQIWENCYDTRERIEYFRRHSFTSNGIAALLRAMRGDWYEAANMLHCPSDLIA